MPSAESVPHADRGQRRASFRQARSHETRRALVRAAAALWRTAGYADTTVADICRAAGVSKGLFYFYFPRKEDVLAEIGVLSTHGAERAAHDLLRQPYEVADVVEATLAGFERAMRRNPPELVVEAVLEGYRFEHRGLSGQRPPVPVAPIFGELFERARADGKLPAHVDTARLALLAQTLISEGARHWAAGAFGERSFTEVVAGDIRALVAGFGLIGGSTP